MTQMPSFSWRSISSRVARDASSSTQVSTSIALSAIVVVDLAARPSRARRDVHGVDLELSVTWLPRLLFRRARLRLQDALDLALQATVVTPCPRFQSRHGRVVQVSDQ